jgi:hypothetical protein
MSNKKNNKKINKIAKEVDIFEALKNADLDVQSLHASFTKIYFAACLLNEESLVNDDAETISLEYLQGYDPETVIRYLKLQQKHGYYIKLITLDEFESQIFNEDKDCI